LNLSGNRFLGLPDFFGQLMALQSLDPSQNFLFLLPETFQSLKQLRKLELNQNRLTRLPRGSRTAGSASGSQSREQSIDGAADSFGGHGWTGRLGNEGAFDVVRDIGSVTILSSAGGKINFRRGGAGAG